MTLDEVSEKSLKIRELYYELEILYHTKKWSPQEDALGFLTDASLVGRYVMSKQERWPSDDEGDLAHKIGECVWWLAVIASKNGVDFSQSVCDFLNEKMTHLNK